MHLFDWKLTKPLEKYLLNSFIPELLNKFQLFIIHGTY